jgi:hypothetical protein
VEDRRGAWRTGDGVEDGRGWKMGEGEDGRRRTGRMGEGVEDGRRGGGWERAWRMGEGVEDGAHLVMPLE